MEACSGLSRCAVGTSIVSMTPAEQSGWAARPGCGDGEAEGREAKVGEGGAAKEGRAVIQAHPTSPHKSDSAATSNRGKAGVGLPA